MSNDETVTIDVRDTPPHDRRTRVFRAFDRLAMGDALVLIDDHEPRSLFYQFRAEDNGEFTWDYLERGPEAWRVRIGKARCAAPRLCGCADAHAASASPASS
jgi:uncharacterized protein (DUF2249 family)